MMIAHGEKLHIIFRRRFDGDLRRHFLGEVVATEGPFARVIGHTFVFDTASNRYERRPERRVRLIGLADAGVVVNLLPPDVDLEALDYRIVDGHLVITDGRDFRLDINEFGPKR